MRPAGRRGRCAHARIDGRRDRIIGRVQGQGHSWLAEVDGMAQPILGSSEEVVCAALLRIASNGKSASAARA